MTPSGGPGAEPGMQRIALGVEYDGTAYAGWQTQPHAPAVQDALQAALTRVAQHPVRVVAAGRTDTGVHATGQVVHFDTAAARPQRAWVLGTNSLLPADVSVLWALPVPADFHARYAAVSREYRYRILIRAVRPALERDRCWWLRRPLDVDAMRAAARHLLGKHDFSAFRAAACQARSPVRELYRLDIGTQGPGIEFHVQANAFLHHMVRNIVGSLVKVGRGEATAAWLQELLQAGDRRLAGMTAPACGLTLSRVNYPPRFAIPPGAGRDGA